MIHSKELKSICKHLQLKGRQRTVDLRDKVVIVTGASSGIGEATARAMASRGARVVIIAEHSDNLNRVAKSINASGGCAVPIVADFAEPNGASGLVERAEVAAGPVDILVNNVGVGMQALIGERSMEDLRYLFEVNFFAMTTLCSEVLPRMAQRGSGRIINVSSAAAQFGCASFSAYSASKAALRAYTQALRVEARVKGVAVTEVIPISVRTPFFDNVKGKAYKPVGVVITAEQVANCIVRCAASDRPQPEVWPFRWIRLVFLLNVLAPGLIVRYNTRTFERNSRAHREEGRGKREEETG
jgi:short-subunit dehydrogenase